MLLEVIADIVIFITFVSIPLLLMTFVWSSGITHQVFESPSKIMIVSVAVLFTLFTMMCGLTHLFTAFLHFNSLSAPGAVVGSKVATAVVSVATAIVMYLIMPMILEMLRLVEVIRKGRLQEMSRLMRLVTEHCTEVIATHSVDQHLRFLSANGASESCFGKSPHELIGQSVFSVIHEDDAEQVKNILEDVMHRALQTTVTDLTATRMEYRVKNLQDGEPKWMESSVSIAYEDMQPLLIIITRDITTRRVVEQRRFQETEAERDAAVVNAKLHFLACAAHDLKTYAFCRSPVCLLAAAMHGFCVRVFDFSRFIRACLFCCCFACRPLATFRMAIDELQQTELTHAQKTYLTQAFVCMDLMTLTIAQALDVGRATAGKQLVPRRVTVQLPELLQHCHIVVQGYSRRVPVRSRIAEDVYPAIITDKEWLWQMVSG